MFVQTHFFFQAEDGIRDTSVTGVQTCALPICCSNYTNVDGGGQLNQSGGALIISNLLDFGGFRNAGLLYPLYGRYTFTGGTVTASNINMTEIGRASCRERGYVSEAAVAVKDKR